MILGLYIPNSGNIYNGNINSIKHNQEWFNQFSYIQQTPNIFADTIFSNITLGDEYNKKNISKVLKILDQVDLKNIIHNNQGLNKKLDEYGKIFLVDKNKEL